MSCSHAAATSRPRSDDATVDAILPAWAATAPVCAQRAGSGARSRYAIERAVAIVASNWCGGDEMALPCRWPLPVGSVLESVTGSSVSGDHGGAEERPAIGKSIKERGWILGGGRCRAWERYARPGSSHHPTARLILAASVPPAMRTDRISTVDVWTVGLWPSVFQSAPCGILISSMCGSHSVPRPVGG